MPIDSAILLNETIINVVEEVLDLGDVDDESRASLARLCRALNGLCAKLDARA